MQPGLPGIHVNTHIFRQANFIHTAIHNLTFAVLLGCILVVFVLIAFLFQWRAAFVSLMAIPLSLAAAAVVLDAEGATINTMILAGFGVAVGVVVDDAIIDMENIVRRLRNWRAAGRRTTPAAPAARLLARGPHGDPVRDPDQHRRGAAGGVRRRPDRVVLPPAGGRLRARGAGVDGGGADRHAGAGDGADAERAAQSEGPAADRLVQAPVPKAARPGAQASADGDRSGDRRDHRRRAGAPRPRPGPVPDLQGTGSAHALRHQARDLAAGDEAHGQPAAAEAASDPGPPGHAGRLPHRPGAPG